MKPISDVHPNEPPMTKQLEAVRYYREEAAKLGLTEQAQQMYAKEKFREWHNRCLARGLEHAGEA